MSLRRPFTRTLAPRICSEGSRQHSLGQVSRVSSGHWILTRSTHSNIMNIMSIVSIDSIFDTRIIVVLRLLLYEMLERFVWGSLFLRACRPGLV